MITFFVGFFWSFLCYFWLCPFFKNQIVFGLGLSYDFLVFYYFFLRLCNSLQKNKLSSFILDLSGLGTPWFSFLSHAVILWFVVFSKLR